MKYKLAPTKQFMKMLKAQPHGLEKQINKTLRHLQENPTHPSLRSEKYQSIESVWESSINMKNRVIWQYGAVQKGTIILLAFGDHEIFYLTE